MTDNQPSRPHSLGGADRPAADAAHHAARAATHPDDASRPAGGAIDGERISPAIGAPAGALAGAMAGLQSGALAGALTLGLGAVAGAAMGAAAGVALAADSEQRGFTAEHDAHYRALYEGRPIADRRYDDVRAAYAYGHLAAAEPELADRAFDEVEPELRTAWSDELRGRAGAWEAVRPYVRDAFGHARAEGVGARRDTRVIGSAGSAVDPVELDRARRGEPSDGRPAVTHTPESAPYQDAVEQRSDEARPHDRELR